MLTENYTWKKVKWFLWEGGNFYNWPFYLRCISMLALVTVVTLIKIHWLGYIGLPTPFILYSVVIILTARYFGVGTAILSTVVCAIVSFYFFIPPFASFNGFNKPIGAGLFVFLLEGFFIAGLGRLAVASSKKLKRNQQRFKALIENSSDAITMMTVNGKFVYASPSIQRVTGYTINEFLNIDAAEILKPDERIVLVQKIDEMIREEIGTITYTHQLKHKSGKWLWIESVISNQIKNEDINAIVSNFRDVTDKVLYQQEKDDFIGIASHELKNPLTSLKLHLELLDISQESADAETRKRYTQKALQQLNRILNLMNELLNVSKIEAGKIDLKPERFYIEELIYESIETHLTGFANAAIKVEGDLKVRLSGDKQKLQQVLLNLLSNAMKYSPENSPITLKVSHNGFVKIEVIDKGVGIPEHKQASIFKKFERIGDQQKISGFGLGLYISEKIINAHGGNIGVISKEGEGADFWFTLPIKQKDLR